MLDQDDERYNWIPTRELEMLKKRNMFLFRHCSNRKSRVGRFDRNCRTGSLAYRLTDIRHGP